MKTSWKRRVKAPSSSIFSRYSSSVVAPIHWTWPRANAGFKILEASPAPTRVWISSIKMITLGFSLSSSTIIFILSSNSPRYFVPATMVLILRETIRLLNNVLATFLSTIRWAMASTNAVLPTPGSPKIIGLFFFLRERTWQIRWISLSLPIIGSNLPSAAILVRSSPNWSIIGVPLPPLFFLES